MDMINRLELIVILASRSIECFFDMLGEQDIEKLQWYRGRLSALNEVRVLLEDWGEDNEDERHKD